MRTGDPVLAPSDLHLRPSREIVNPNPCFSFQPPLMFPPCSFSDHCRPQDQIVPDFYRVYRVVDRASTFNPGPGVAAMRVRWVAGPFFFGNVWA